MCEAVGKVPAGNRRLIREETLNLPVAGRRGARGQNDMANKCESSINAVIPNKRKLLIRLNKNVSG